MADRATAGRQFGIAMRRLRSAAGLSIGALAQQTQFSKSHISKVENGLKSPSQEFARAIDASLLANGQLIALAAELVKPARPSMSAAGGTPHGGSPVPHTTDSEIGFLSAAPAIGFEGDTSLEAFRALLKSLRDLGQVLDPASIVEMIKPCALVLRQLAHGAEPESAREIWVMGSRFAEFAGWMAQEIGDDVSALRWTDEAVELARAAGDQDLAAYANVRRANIAMYQQDAYGTITFARQAQEMECSNRTKGLAAQREAQGHALAGDYTEFQRCISLSARLLEHDPGSARDELVLGSARIPSTVALAEGWSLHDLGFHSQAAGILTLLLERTPHQSLSARARIGARLALALASMRELDRVCAVIQPLLALGVATRSATVRADLRQLAKLLNRWPSDPLVQRMMPELSAALTPTSSSPAGSTAWQTRGA